MQIMKQNNKLYLICVFGLESTAYGYTNPIEEFEFSEDLMIKMTIHFNANNKYYKVKCLKTRENGVVFCLLMDILDEEFI
jgi:hypothetical protein